MTAFRKDWTTPAGVGRDSRMAGHTQNTVLFSLALLILAGLAVMEINAANARADRWEEKADALTESLLATSREKAGADAAIASLRTELTRLERERKFAQTAFSRKECLALLGERTAKTAAVKKKPSVAAAFLPAAAPALPAAGDPLDGFVDADGNPVPSNETMIMTAGDKGDTGTVNRAELSANVSIDVELGPEPGSGEIASQAPLSYAEDNGDSAPLVVREGMEFLEIMPYEENRSAQFQEKQ